MEVYIVYYTKFDQILHIYNMLQFRNNMNKNMKSSRYVIA